MGYRGPNVIFPETVHPEGSGNPTPPQPRTPRPSRVPIWKRLVVAVSMTGTVLLCLRAQDHWHHIPMGVFVAAPVVLGALVGLIVGRILGLPKGWLLRS